MSWGFRVVRQNNSFAIHYAYYNESGELISISETPVSPLCEDVEDLQETLRFMLSCCDAPAVDQLTLKPLGPEEKAAMSEEGKYFYEFGRFRLDPVKRRLMRDGEQVRLTPKESSVHPSGQFRNFDQAISPLKLTAVSYWL